MYKKISFLVIFNFLFSQLFFSEYSEGSSNHKYLEIYNATNQEIDLSGYAYPNATNGANVDGTYDYWNAFDAGSIISANDVFVICHPSADASAIQPFCNQTHTYLSNGDDGFCLVEGNESSFTKLDCIGTWSATDPGDGWDVAGVTNGTKDHTLVRKASVLSGNAGDWSLSSGTDEFNSEWIVYEQNTWEYLGSHTIDTSGNIYGCMDANACNYNPDATADNGTCASEDCLGECGGSALVDDCGVCGGENATLDCEGVCDGSAVEDECGVCNGDGTGCEGQVIFFSEYAEGTSNNKYLEIYNGMGAGIDLSNYSLSSCSNGCNDGVSWDYPDNVTFDSGTVLAAGDVYVVCHGSADALIQAQCDQNFTYLSNGNDAFALTELSTGLILDIIGVVGDDPGNGWEVAGVGDATKDHTLVRKATVLSGNSGDWSLSAGTSETNSEWLVYEQNTWTYLGYHEIDNSGNIYGCMDISACNYNPDATADNGTCAVDDCSGECGGSAVIDDCGVCGGENASLDCENVCGGSAILDGCGVCTGGNTGLEACEIEESSMLSIINNCSSDLGNSIDCEGQYDLSASSASECPLYEQSVITSGIIVDYFDITPWNGPHSFTLEDAAGNNLDFVVWPTSSEYQDGFDITATALNVLTQEPFGIYEVQITGELGAYCDDDEQLDISSEWQITVEYESDITIVEEFSPDDFGCTDLDATNYDPSATIDDGSCISEAEVASILDIVNNCSFEAGETISCDGQYDLSTSSASQCPLYEEPVTTSGIIVDYFDITPFNGPHSFTIQDPQGNQIDFVVWPESSFYQDGFDITSTDLNVLTQQPFGVYEVQITGELGAYCDDDEQLDISSEWQITVEYESDISFNLDENPVAVIGEDFSVDYGDTVTLDGTSSYAFGDGSIVGYYWNQESGTPVFYGEPEASSISFVAPDEFTNLVFSLQVTDDLGSTSVNYITIVVGEVGEVTISDIINNCSYGAGETISCDGQYDLSTSSASECPLYEQSLTTSGLIVDYFDITPFNGPHSFTIQDADGNLVDFVVWPTSSEYQNGFDITSTDLNVLTQQPFGVYEVQITGELGAYCDDDEQLDISSEWQITVEYESDISFNLDENPVAIIGDDFSVDYGDTVTLDGTSSYAFGDGSIVGYYWNQESGTPVFYGEPEASSISFVAPDEFTSIMFSLQVTDDLGSTSVNYIIITVGEVGEVTISDIINNCSYGAGETISCDGQYDLSTSSASECPLYEQSLTTSGLIVDYFDITPFNGPHSFTIQDAEGNLVDFVVWPTSSEYQNGFDITSTDLNVLTQQPFGVYEVQITGELGAYCDDDEQLDISSEWQITVEYESDIVVDGSVGECVADGDVTGDGTINVLDVISTVNHILGNATLEDDGFCSADFNDDGIINVTDIISLINMILGN